MSGIGAVTWQGYSVLGNILLTLLLLNAGISYLNHRHKDRVESKRHMELFTFLKSFLTQKMVDDRLRELASAYYAAAQHQARVLRDPQDDAAVRDASYEVSEAKEAFWKAHDGARANGYKVEPSFKAYLPTSPHAAA